MIRKGIRLFLTIALLLALGSQGAFAAQIIRSGDPEVKQISITIDDCWNMDHMASYLDLCKEYDIKTTIFPVGQAIKAQDQALWQRAIDEGHEIGNHTFSHPKLTDYDANTVMKTLKNMEKRLNEVLGYEYPIRLMRPPYGSTNNTTVKAIEKAGYEYVVKWNIDTTDSSKVLRQVKNGSILLFHANKKDIDCLRKIVPTLLEEGYEIVTISKLIGIEAEGMALPVEGDAVPAGGAE